MNITEISMTISSEDIKSIIEDFLEVPGLAIDKIHIDKYIYIYGSYKKIVRIPFKITISIIEIKEHNILFQLEKIQLAKVSVFKWLKNFALKKAIKTLQEYGITFNKGIIDMRIPTLLEKLPIKLQFRLRSLELHKDLLCVEVEKICINVNGQAALKDIDAVKMNELESPIPSKVKVEDDKYGKVRADIKNKLPEKYRDVLPYIMLLPDIMVLVLRLFKDKRIPVKAKLICGSIITYFALPIDILPDFLPIIGKIDDVAIAFYALDKILCEVPEEVIKDNWAGREDIILIIRKGIDIIYKTIGTSNLVKGYSWVAKTIKKKRRNEVSAEEKEIETNGKEILRN